MSLNGIKTIKKNRWIHTVVMKGDEKLLVDAVEIDGAKLSGRFTGIFKNGMVE